MPTPGEFARLASRNPHNAVILDRLAHLGLGECHLAAGCLFQTVWNCLTGREPTSGIRDYDIFYFDDDLSWEAEDDAIRHAEALFSDLHIRVEVRNQARVHLWYEARFGSPCPTLRSARDGINQFLIACTCVGISSESREVHAPDGFDDLWAGILRINPRNPRPDLFRNKAADYRTRWPWLRIVPADPP